MDARELFPLTCRHLGAAAPAATSPADFVERVCTAHSRGDIPDRAVRDLVQYEALLHELRPAPPRAPAPLPGDDQPVVLAPHVRVLVFGAALPDMLAALREKKPATPRPARGWIVVWRDGEGRLEELILPREEGWVLERFRQPVTPADALDDDEREEFARLWSHGIVVRA